MPRFRPDGSVNALRLQRLKDKLGNRSNASSEVEFVQAFAWRVGEEGRGVRTIIEMVQLTRIDCVISSAGMMRMALAQALHHARHRTVFQKHLADQPMMGTLLADMALEVEGATALTMRLCRSFDLAAGDREGSGACAAADARGEVLGVQDRARLHLRGDGMPRRQWVRGGNAARAALPRGAGQRDLGRLGQRDVPRRAARALARGRGGACRPRRTGASMRRFAWRKGGRCFHREDTERCRWRGAGACGSRKIGLAGGRRRAHRKCAERGRAIRTRALARATRRNFWNCGFIGSRGHNAVRTGTSRPEAGTGGLSGALSRQVETPWRRT